MSGTSTDAINGSQLFATNQAVAAIAASTPTHYYSVNDGGTQQANYTNNGATGANSLAAGVAASASGDQALAQGFQASASAGDAIAIGTGTKASAVSSTAIGVNATASTPASAWRSSPPRWARSTTSVTAAGHHTGLGRQQRRRRGT
ncbi:hypothetical protein ABL848_36490 (plasmid) [Variovorax sp. NFACC28]